MRTTVHLDHTSVAAIVVHYDSPDTLHKTLENLSQVFDRDHIIVVDNSSSLEDEPIHDLATVVADGENRGYAGGVNRGFEIVSSTLPSVTELLVCTHETLFRIGAIERLLTTAANYPDGHIVGPRLVTKSGSEDFRIWSNGGTLNLPFFYPKHNTNPSLHGVHKVAWVDGAAFLIDIETFRRIQGVPEEFFMYMEDVALGLLARGLGVPVLVELSAIAEQTANGPSRALAIRNRTLLASRYMDAFSRRVVSLEILIRQLGLAALPSISARNKARESREAVKSARALLAVVPPRVTQDYEHSRWTKDTEANR